MSDELVFGDDIQEGEERIGGGWSADESHVKLYGIETAFITKSTGGATAVNLHVATKEGDKRQFTIYISNKKGETFYVDKKTSRKVMLPGYQLVNNICLAATGHGFQEVFKAAKMKTIELYDRESRKEIPQEVKTLVALHKKGLKLGIIKTISNGYKNGKPTNDKREGNEIHMVFRKEDNKTPKEHADGVESAAYAKWQEYWIGRDRNDWKEVAEQENEGENLFGETASDDDLFGDSTDTASPEPTTSAEPSVADDDEENPFA